MTRREGAAPTHPQPTAVYGSQVADGWDILGNANGGYLLASVARACAIELDRPDPVSITGHFLSPGTPGPTTIEVSTQRVGRRFATAAANLRAGDGKLLLSALGSFADLSEADGPLRVDAQPPDLPPVEECLGAPPPVGEGGEGPNFMHKVDMRLHPADAGFRHGRPSGDPRVRGWFRMPDGEHVDPLGLLCVLDAFPPTVFNSDLPVAWVPTLEFTAHVRCRPAPGWLACEFTTRIVSSGFLEEDGLVWDSEGRLVAQSRQLALVPRG
ncbi:MAG: thioesterase family protein [Actinomycetia bacterium]|nr:thioesterase family protein [Actinomycetes bacterium]